MKDNTKKKLNSFVKHNNWQMPHPLDMERFYSFIIEAYKNGDTQITADDFSEIIKPVCNINEEELHEWLIKYENGIELLKINNDK
jgi:hypothetical protein